MPALIYQHQVSRKVQLEYRQRIHALRCNKVNVFYTE